jgi:hypothetical protein
MAANVAKLSELLGGGDAVTISGPHFRENKYGRGYN